MASGAEYEAGLKREIIQVDEDFLKSNKYGSRTTRQLRRANFSGARPSIEQIRILNDLSILCQEFGAGEAADLFAMQVSNECDASVSIDMDGLKEISTDRLYMNREAAEARKMIPQTPQQAY